MPRLSEFRSAAKIGHGEQTSSLDQVRGIGGELRRNTNSKATVSSKEGGKRARLAQSFPRDKEHGHGRPILGRITYLLNLNRRRIEPHLAASPRFVLTRLGVIEIDRGRMGEGSETVENRIALGSTEKKRCGASRWQRNLTEVFPGEVEFFHLGGKILHKCDKDGSADYGYVLDA